MSWQHRWGVLLVLVVTLPWYARATAQTDDSTARFEVASIKRNTDGHFGSGPPYLPNGDVRLINVPIRNLVLSAYPENFSPIEIIGLPSWAESERYDVVAKGKPAPTPTERQQMWRALLAERMKLAAHYETREKTSYELVIASASGKLGPGLNPSTLDCTKPAGPPAPPPAGQRPDLKVLGMSRCAAFSFDRDQTMYAGGVTLGVLARMIAPTAGRPVVDRTGLSGNYSVVMRFQRGPQRADAVPGPDDPPSLFTALQEQLGLKLRDAKTQAHALRFDVVSVKEHVGTDRSVRFEAPPPDGYRQANLDLQSYIRIAYQVPQPERLTGLPNWTLTARYDIVGKASRRISEDERRAMLRDVLASRFHMRAHFESREQQVYVMTAARPDRRLGPGLKPRPDCESSPCESGGSGRADGVGMRAVTLKQLADGMLSALTRQVVIDETGIAGAFDISVSWRPDRANDDPNDSRPSLFTALQEQLGLKLEPERRPVDVLVVDHIERPDPD